MKREKTKDRGVYTRTSDTRRHNGKPDICYDITYKDANGKKYWQKVGWRSEGISQAFAVKTRMDTMELMRSGGRVSRKDRMLTFDELFSMYVSDHLETEAKRERARASYNRAIRGLLGFRIVRDMTIRDIEQTRGKLLSAGYAPGTVCTYLCYVRAALNCAKRWGFQTQESVLTFSTNWTENRRQRFLTPEEAQALLEELKPRSRAWHDAVLVALNTGMRKSEIFGLKWHQIHFSSGYIDVVDSKPGVYTAYMTESVAAVLKARRKNGSVYVFPGKTPDMPVRSEDLSTLYRAVDACALNNGITDRRFKVCFHTLRHTFASWLVQRGISLAIVQRLMGHASITMTERYAKLAPDNMSGAANIIGHMLTPSRGHGSGEETK